MGRPFLELKGQQGAARPGCPACSNCCWYLYVGHASLAPSRAGTQSNATCLRLSKSSDVRVRDNFRLTSCTCKVAHWNPVYKALKACCRGSGTHSVPQTVEYHRRACMSSLRACHAQIKIWDSWNVQASGLHGRTGTLPPSLLCERAVLPVCVNKIVMDLA